MARAANTAVTAAEPNELYETLTDEGKLNFEDCGRMGYKPYRSNDLWFARPLGAEDGTSDIGPAGSIEELTGLVADYTQANLTETVLDSDEDGNRYLPGAEETMTEVDIPELRKPALDYHAYKTERISALAREVEAKKALDLLMHKHEAELPVDRITKIKYFKVGTPDGRGRAVIIDLVKGSDKIKSRIVDEGGDGDEEE